jgi:hypothetical protein
MKNVTITIVRSANVARPICDHLLNHDHTHTHRMAVGVMVMTVGVCIAKAAGHNEIALIAYIGDGIGYAIHGLGLTPFIEILVTKFAEATGSDK